MKRFITAMLLLCSTLMLHAAKTDKEVTITVGNESREYWLYVPDNVKAEAPLVVSLHGASGHDTDKSPFRTDVADKEGCIVAYPQGKLCFQSEGDATLTIGVKIQKLTSPNNTVLEATVQAGSAAVLPFDIADGWGEYQITFTRPSTTTDITISNIGIYSRTEEETTGIVAMQNNKNDHYLCDLQGRQVTNPQHGLYIINGKK